MVDGLDLGIMVEGVVDVDPSGKLVLRVHDVDGREQLLDIQAQFTQHMGKEVRFIVSPMDAIAALAKLIASGEVQL